MKTILEIPRIVQALKDVGEFICLWVYCGLLCLYSIIGK